MLKLDLESFSFGVRTVKYDLPEPFGPDGGPAYIAFDIVPVNMADVKYRAELDEIHQRANVLDLKRDDAFAKTGDREAFVKTNDENIKAINWAMLNMHYRFCVTGWSTNIQSGGKDLDCTEQNFMALHDYGHPELLAVFAMLQVQIGKRSAENEEAEAEAAEDELKN